MRAATMGGQVPPDHCLAGIVAFGFVIRRADPAARDDAARGFVIDMTEEELQRAHDAGEALSRLAGMELAQRRRT